MIKKTNLLTLFFLMLTFSFSAEKNYKKSNFNFLLNYTNIFPNMLTALSASFVSFKLLNLFKKNSYYNLKPFPQAHFLAHVISVLLPLLVSGLRARMLYNKLTYDYIIKNFDSIKRQDYWFDKLAMIDDFKINLLDKSGFKEDSVSYHKYKVLLDILTKSPNKIINELDTNEKQQNFLSLVLLLDIYKTYGRSCNKLQKIKDAFETISSFKNKKLSGSIFFNNSETIKHFIKRVDSEIAAEFIIQYKNDIKSFVDFFISLDLLKQQAIFSATWQTNKSENDNQQKLPIITAPILFDIIVTTFDEKGEAAGCSLLENLSDQNFFTLISYVQYQDSSIKIKDDKLNSFFDLITCFYQQNIGNISNVNNLFTKKYNFIMCQDKNTGTNILGWFLSKVAFKKEQPQETRSATVNLCQDSKQNNYSVLPFSSNNSSAKDRLARLSFMKKKS